MVNDQFSRRDFLKKSLKLTGGAAAVGTVSNALRGGPELDRDRERLARHAPSVWEWRAGAIQWVWLGTDRRHPFY